MKKITSILLIVTLLGATAGITSGVHYCGGKIFERSIGFIDIGSLHCGMEATGEKSCDQNPDGFSNKCCENHIQKLQVENNYFSSSLKVQFNSQFEIIPLLVEINFQHRALTTPLLYKTYKPPLLESDIPIEIQSFLI